MSTELTVALICSTTDRAYLVFVEVTNNRKPVHIFVQVVKLGWILTDTHSHLGVYSCQLLLGTTANVYRVTVTGERSGMIRIHDPSPAFAFLALFSFSLHSRGPYDVNKSTVKSAFMSS